LGDGPIAAAKPWKGCGERPAATWRRSATDVNTSTASWTAADSVELFAQNDSDHF
jgi:hypothetical protein